MVVYLFSWLSITGCHAAPAEWQSGELGCYLTDISIYFTQGVRSAVDQPNSQWQTW